MMSDGPSREYLLKAAEAEDAAGGVSVGGMAVDLGMPLESPLAEVASFELVDGGWKATLHGTLDRGTSLDELILSPEQFKPGTIVTVREPRE